MSDQNALRQIIGDDVDEDDLTSTLYRVQTHQPAPAPARDSPPAAPPEPPAPVVVPAQEPCAEPRTPEGPAPTATSPAASSMGDTKPLAFESEQLQQLEQAQEHAQEQKQQNLQETETKQQPKGGGEEQRRTIQHWVQRLRAPLRFFVVKSKNEDNLRISRQHSIWATQPHNEAKLNQAYNDGDVILVFSVNNSRHFQGYAKMSSRVGEYGAEPTDAAWSTAGGSSQVSTWGRSFRAEWLCACELPFEGTMHLRNPANENKPVKISRDGQELPSSLGIALCTLADEAAERGGAPQMPIPTAPPPQQQHRTTAANTFQSVMPPLLARPSNGVSGDEFAGIFFQQQMIASQVEYMRQQVQMREAMIPSIGYVLQPAVPLYSVLGAQFANVDFNCWDARWSQRSSDDRTYDERKRDLKKPRDQDRREIRDETKNRRDDHRDDRERAHRDEREMRGVDRSRRRSPSRDKDRRHRYAERPRSRSRSKSPQRKTREAKGVR